MKEKKAYFYSFDKIHAELKLYLSVDYERYAQATELEILCRDYLYPERIGNQAYCEIEWSMFGVTSRHLKKIIGWINNPLEGLRVMVYFRDHPQEILGAEADEKTVRAFEHACCKEVSEIMNNYKYQRQEQDYPSAHEIIYGCWYQYYELEEIKYCGKGTQLIAKKLPYGVRPDGQYLPFNVYKLVEIGIEMHDRLLTNINHTPQELLDGEISGWFNVDDFVVETRKRLISREQRLLPEDDNWPLLQTLFVVAVLLLTERDAEEKKKNLKPLYQELSDYFLDYLKDNFYDNFWWVVKLRSDILEQCEGMNYLDFARAHEYPEQWEQEKDVHIDKDDTLQVMNAEQVTTGQKDAETTTPAPTSAPGKPRGPKTQYLFADVRGNEDTFRSKTEAERVRKFVADHRMGNMQLDSQSTNRLNLMVACFWYRWNERGWVSQVPQGAAIYRFFTEQCELECAVRQKAFSSKICNIINAGKKDYQIYDDLDSYFRK